MVKKTENMALEETRSVLHDLEIQKKSIKKQLECGIINSVDASQEEENIMTKERKSPLSKNALAISKLGFSVKVFTLKNSSSFFSINCM